MVRSVKVIDVFVASPSDVAEERDRLESAIRELNEQWSSRLNVEFNLVRWETHSYPGFGEDAQDVINRELPGPFDVFVGIMWARAGTPTERADSGTIEEFERSYEQWKADPDSIRLLMYFKKADVPWDQIDPDQIKLVSAFEASLPAKGGFSWSFNNPDEFEALARKHLTRILQEFSDKPTLQESIKPSTLPHEHSPLDDEEGLLDLVEIWEKEMQTVKTIVELFTDALMKLNEAIVVGTEEVGRVNASNSPSKMSEAKRIISRMASQMELFGASIEPELPTLDKSFNRGMQSLDKAIEIAPDFGKDGIEGICSTKEPILQFRDTIRENAQTIGTLQKNISDIPRITTRFNKGKRTAIKALGHFLQVLNSAGDQVDASLELICALCGEGESEQ